VNKNGLSRFLLQVELHPPSVELGQPLRDAQAKVGTLLLGELGLELPVGAEPGHLLRRHEVRDLLVRKLCRNSSFTDREISYIQTQREGERRATEVKCGIAERSHQS
jgi:hypothetical protein